MIALPGLTFATGRFDDAKKNIQAFAQSISQGMLPNRFPVGLRSLMPDDPHYSPVYSGKEDKMTKEEHMDVEASFDDTDLEELTTRLKRFLDIQDRKYGFPSKTYPKCFVGSEAVTQLVKEGLRSTRKTPCASAI
jgi:hypothetical protein